MPTMTFKQQVVLRWVPCVLVTAVVLAWSLNVVVHKPSLILEMKDIRSLKQTMGYPANETMVMVPYDQLEEIRREVSSGLRSAAAFLRTSLRDLSNTVKASANESVNSVLAEAEDRLRVIQFDLSSIDQLGKLTDWRQKEAAILTQEVQRRIHALQNPMNCSNAKKIVCRMSRDGGAASLIHHLVYCIMAAYGSGKTFVLHSRGWRYSPDGWEVLFEPLSHTCVNISSGVIDPWPGTNESEAVMFPDWDRSEPKPAHQPMAVPVDIASRLQRFHEMPSAWWVGQFISYMMRIRPEMQQIINQVQMQLNFSHPIVGVHVRRTDKTSEAKLFPIEEYMIHVENYYQSLDLKSPLGVPAHRRVFLASDQSSLITEAKKKYQNYEFLWHKNNAENMQNRYNLLSFKDFITELYFLAHSDFLVCTFSSNVCRLAYEMMQSVHADAPSRIISLDTNYFFHHARPRYLKVRFPHRPSKTSEALREKRINSGVVWWCSVCVEVLVGKLLHGLHQGGNFQESKKAGYILPVY
ncbi:alpha-(1,6)-fucosyltransferase-like isoform X2 [Scylla paramamosain]|uniref:alpha-(1,6)-fucosyltransferase-like isoform X2 n=1 Tax=Scylla paramamosain TaxID=85552 RepID=UPI003082BD4F